MLVVDRFEGDFAVVETDGGLVNIPRADLPEGAREKDVLRIEIDYSNSEDRTKAMWDKLARAVGR